MVCACENVKNISESFAINISYQCNLWQCSWVIVTITIIIVFAIAVVVALLFISSTSAAIVCTVCVMISLEKAFALANDTQNYEYKIMNAELVYIFFTLACLWSMWSKTKGVAIRWWWRRLWGWRLTTGANGF